MEKMTVSQLSIFLENSNGTFLRVLDVLKEANISLIATTIADTSDYGICRIICDYPMRAVEILRQTGLAVAVTEVFALSLENRPGAAVEVLKIFQAGEQNLPYLYSFMARDRFIMVCRTENFEQSGKIIRNEGICFLTDEDLPQFS